MKTHTPPLVAFLLLGAVFAASTGCTTVQNAASSTVSWIRGALEVSVEHPIDRVGNATTGAVNGMKFSDVVSKVDAATGEITARTSQDTKIQILLRRTGEKTTEISIRVGVFGDEALSRQINEEIAKRL